MNRQQRRHQQQQTISLADLKAQLREEMAGEMEAIIEMNTYRLINGFLLAMNSELKVGATRGERVIAKANEFIESLSPEDLHKLVRMRIYKEEV